MSKLDDNEQRFSNGVGAVFGLFFGATGTHGVAENYFTPDGAAETNIHVHTDAVHVNAATVGTTSSDAAPVQEVTQSAPQEQSVEDWYHAAREAAAAAELRHAAETLGAHEVGAGREQSLYPLAVDPVAYYAQQDDSEDHQFSMR